LPVVGAVEAVEAVHLHYSPSSLTLPVVAVAVAVQDLMVVALVLGAGPTLGITLRWRVLPVVREHLRLAVGAVLVVRLHQYLWLLVPVVLEADEVHPVVEEHQLQRVLSEGTEVLAAARVTISLETRL
jgi:hypothetical protein